MGLDSYITGSNDVAGCVTICSNYNQAKTTTAFVGVAYRLDDNLCYLKGSSDGRFDDVLVQSALLEVSTITTTSTTSTASIASTTPIDGTSPIVGTTSIVGTASIIGIALIVGTASITKVYK